MLLLARTVRQAIAGPFALAFPRVRALPPTRRSEILATFSIRQLFRSSSTQAIVGLSRRRLLYLHGKRSIGGGATGRGVSSKSTMPVFRIDALHCVLFGFCATIFLFDTMWFIRVVYHIVHGYATKRPSTELRDDESTLSDADSADAISIGIPAIFEPTDYRSICFTQDLDLLFHMNNSRYLREADFARFKHFNACGVQSYVVRKRGRMVLAASAMRYRKSINFLNRFRIETHIVSWDENYIYSEQRFVTTDDMVRAVGYFKLHVHLPSDTNVNVMMRELTGRADLESPANPPALQSWIDFNQLSSDTLRAESGLPPSTSPSLHRRGGDQ